MNVLVQLKLAFRNKNIVQNVLLCLCVIIVMHLLYGVYRSSTTLQEGARRGKTNNCSKKTLRKCKRRFKKNCIKLHNKVNKRKWRRTCTVKTMKNCLRQYKRGCDRKRRKRGREGVVKPPVDPDPTPPPPAPSLPPPPTPTPPDPVLGCTDKTAVNYDPTAKTDDGSCEAVRNGCTDPTAFNYDPTANTDDGWCISLIEKIMYLYDQYLEAIDFIVVREKIIKDTSPILVICKENAQLRDECGAIQATYSNYSRTLVKLKKEVTDYMTDVYPFRSFVFRVVDENAIKTHVNTLNIFELKLLRRKIDEFDTFISTLYNDEGTVNLEAIMEDIGHIKNRIYDIVAANPDVRVVYGCMDTNYTEYNPKANTDDDSCATEIVDG